MANNLNKKIIKILVATVIATTLVLGGAIIFLAKTFDQETLKNKAVQLVYEKTGRNLKVNGPITLTFFPWLGVKIENVALSNPQNFKDNDFAQAAEVGANIKLLPLIWGDIEIGNVTLRNLQLQLIKNSAGINNWQDLATANNPSVATTTTDKNQKSGLEKLRIGSVTIDNGNISWQDQTLNKKIKISKFNFYSKNISLSRPFSISLSLHLDDLTSTLNGDITVNTQIKLDLTHEFYEFKHLQLSGKLKNTTMENFANFTGKAEVTLDLKKPSINIDALKFNIAGADIIGTCQGLNITTQPKFSGNLTVSSTNAKELMQLLGFDKFFKPAPTSSFKATLLLMANSIKLPTIEAHLNDMLLQGNAEYATNNLTFNLALNKLDGAIFAPKEAIEKTPTTLAAKTHPKTTDVAATNSIVNPKTITTLNGKITIGTILFDKLQLTNFTTEITGNTNTINCPQMGFDFYQGKAHGNAKINLSNNIPNINLMLTLENAAIKSLLTNLANFDKFSGTMTINTNINPGSITGDGRVLISHGSYSGIDIPYEVRRAHAILNAKPIPQKATPPHTDFDQLTMTFKIDNGTLNTNDLLIQAQDYKVTGQGNANLTAKNINFSLSAYSTHDENFFVPIKINGTFNNPSVRFDAAVMLQQTVKKAIKNVVQKQVEKYLPQDLQQQINKILPLDKLLH